jgi:hypothetical protein
MAANRTELAFRKRPAAAARGAMAVCPRPHACAVAQDHRGSTVSNRESVETGHLLGGKA